MAEIHQPHHYQPQQQHHQRPGDAMKGMFSENNQEGPSASKVLAVVTLLPIGGFLLIFAGLTFVGTLIGLAVSTPLLVIFSPVLVPATIVTGLAVAGFLTSGAFGITGLSSLSWIANYLRQTRVPEHMDNAKRRVQDTAGYYGQRAREMGQNVKENAQETGREVTARTQEGSGTQDAMKGMFSEDNQEGPSASKVLAVGTLLPIGGFLLIFAGLTFVGTLIGLAVSTPLLVIFSPVLVTVVIVIGLAVTGFLTSGAFGITGLSSLSCIANYLRQTRVPEHMDYAKRRVQDTAGYYGQRAREKGHNVKEKAQETGREVTARTQEGSGRTQEERRGTEVEKLEAIERDEFLGY